MDGNDLNCSITEVHMCKHFAHSRYAKCNSQESNLQLIDHMSDVITTTPHKEDCATFQGGGERHQLGLYGGSLA